MAIRESWSSLTTPPNSLRLYLAVTKSMTISTTSCLLLQKWFARHGTPTRMQSDNAPSLIAEVSNEFMKASQVTKVTSTAVHPRTQGLVERQIRTLLTLLRVLCFCRMRDWDRHLDEVLGAYNPTPHATTGFFPHVLTRGTEKAIPLTYLSLSLRLNLLQLMMLTWTTCWHANKKFMT